MVSISGSPLPASPDCGSDNHAAEEHDELRHLQKVTGKVAAHAAELFGGEALHPQGGEDPAQGHGRAGEAARLFFVPAPLYRRSARLSTAAAASKKGGKQRSPVI